MRPIYHWQPYRVKAYMAISFMAFVCVRHLVYLVASISHQKLSAEKIKQALLQVQASVIEDQDSNKTFLLTSQMPARAERIYRLVGIKPPKRTTEISCGA